MNRRQLILIGALILIMFFIPIIIYIIKFHDYSISDDPDKWGIFGDYIQGTSVAILAFVGLVITYVFNVISENRNQSALAQQKNAHRPLAYINASDFENYLSVTIKNSGLGPLQIKEFKAIDREGNVRINLIDWMPALPPNFSWSNFFGNPVGYVIEAGKEVPLIAISADNINLDGTELIDAPLSQTTLIDFFSEVRDNIRENLSQLTIEITYQDIYADEMPIAKRSLYWFGRNITTTDETTPRLA